MNIVVDSNILVSAFLTPYGQSWEVLMKAREYGLYLSPFIFSEIWRVLQYDRIRKKYNYTEEDIDDYLKNLSNIAMVIQPQIVLDVCSDPDDNGVLACAVEAEAEYLVTRNIADFPGKFENVTVIHPTQFLKFVFDK